MKRFLRRAVTGSAVAALALGLSAAPAVAKPSGAAFADCPDLPAGADASTWTCYVMTAADTLLRFNKMSAHTTAPVTLTVAQGKLADGTEAAKVGALRGDPIPFVTGVPGTSLETPHPTGWKVRITPTGAIKPGVLVPHEIGLTAQIVGSGLGDACGIGPVTVKPALQWVFPWFDGGLAWRVQAYDSVYALPSAKNCAGNDFTVNQLLGLPANATSNHFQVAWTLRSAGY
ncbi:hypothetical protein [Actinomadura flavalba]|uniref:hypothetical protein n=1 Tax=Actinomadura flavalba TaxID=1120938 RepID=UPI000371B874|nr:hypothetical protein [Actinomadura flavalba]